MWYGKLIIALALCVIAASVVSAQEAQWKDLSQQVVKLYLEGKYAEATKIAEKSLEVAERTFGPDHTAVATSLSNLAQL